MYFPNIDACKQRLDTSSCWTVTFNFEMVLVLISWGNLSPRLVVLKFYFFKLFFSFAVQVMKLNSKMKLFFFYLYIFLVTTAVAVCGSDHIDMKVCFLSFDYMIRKLLVHKWDKMYLKWIQKNVIFQEPLHLYITKKKHGLAICLPLFVLCYIQRKFSPHLLPLICTYNNR